MVKEPKRAQPTRKIESQFATMIERYFGLSHQGTDVRTEFIAGLTTFLTMVYIIFVNPIILGKTGMDQGAVFVATCVAAAVSTLVMALYANYPIALAPGMGINAFFAFTIVLTYKYTWQQALAAVFCSGVLFFLISVLPVRQYVLDSIPQNLKLAVSAGVGLFLGIIALEEAKLIVDHPATLVTLGDLTQPTPVLMLLGFVLIAGLNYRRILGATLIGILVVTLIGLPFGLAQFNGVVSMPPSIVPTLLQLDFSRVTELTFLIVVFSILFVDVFDNAGTLIGVTHRTGLMKNGKLARMKQALISDSFAAMFGALIGTSTTHQLHRERCRCFGGWSHWSDCPVRRPVLRVGAILCAARGDGARLRFGSGFALCRLRDDARSRGDRLGGHDRICARRDHRDYNAADLFDCDRHRPWLHHLRARQNYLWQGEGSFADGDRTCRSVCNQIRGNGVKFDLNLATVGGSVGDFCGPNGNICQGRRRKRECRFCDLRPHDRYSSDPRLHSSGDRPVSVA